LIVAEGLCLLSCKPEFVQSVQQICLTGKAPKRLSIPFAEDIPLGREAKQGL
jgi:hypothetical protein